MRDIGFLLARICNAFLPCPPLRLRRKLKIAEMVLRLRYSRKKRFGLLAIYGWKNSWNRRYADIPDASQDVFVKHRFNVLRENSFHKIAATLNFDGAILINSNGLILHSGIFLEGLRPRRLAEHRLADRRADLSTRLGFKKKVHARHLAAITASWELPGTSIFTISEETGDIHIFEDGQIVFSTVGGENNRITGR